MSTPVYVEIEVVYVDAHLSPTDCGRANPETGAWEPISFDTVSVVVPSSTE